MSLFLRLELSEVEVELGRCSLLQQEVREEEQLFQVLRAQKAAARMQRERKTSQNLQRKMKSLREYGKQSCLPSECLFFPNFACLLCIENSK